MGRILISDLKKKYGSSNITKGKYQKAITDILTYNRNKITNDIASMTDKKIQSSFSTTDRKLVKFPIIKDIAKKHDLLALKAADKGNWVSQTLRDRLTQDLRDSLGKLSDSTKIPQSVVKDFKKRITETFSTYTKDDPILKVPSNVRNIAVTETKSAVNNIRKIYMDELTQRNPDLDYVKIWYHYKSYSKVYRRGHEEQNGVTIGKNEKFKVREFKQIKGRWKPTGKIVLADRPHDDQIKDPSFSIGCSCECKYKIIRKNK
jgi:hypothetical protein